MSAALADQPALFEVANGTPIVVLKWGGGADSTCIIVRYLTEPHLRDFALSDLRVVIALVGRRDEYESTARLAEQSVLPLLARNRVRTIQVGRGGDSAAAGHRILDDTDTPTRLHRDSVSWSYYEYLLTRGLIPNTANRACSDTAKHFALDRVTRELAEGRPHRSMIGFELDEEDRAAKDRKRASEMRIVEHPLISWGFDRRRCLEYLAETIGVSEYPRSCCSFCPYQASQEKVGALMGRWADEPDAAARALFLEHVAMSMHPVMKLFNRTAAADLVADHNPSGVRAAFEALLEQTTWRVYDVRRMYPSKDGDPLAKGKAMRSVRALSAAGTREQAHAELAALAAAEGKPVQIDKYGIARTVLAAKGDLYPCVDRSWVVCPAVVADKQRDVFDDRYEQAESGLLLLKQACS